MGRFCDFLVFSCFRNICAFPKRKQLFDPPSRRNSLLAHCAQTTLTCVPISTLKPLWNCRWTPWYRALEKYTDQSQHLRGFWLSSVFRGNCCTLCAHTIDEIMRLLKKSGKKEIQSLFQYFFLFLFAQAPPCVWREQEKKLLKKLWNLVSPLNFLVC